jgi:hypothetical protein
MEGERMKKEVQNCLSWLVNKLSESNSYESWSNDLKAKQNKEAFEMFNKEVRKHIDFKNLTVDEAIELRFSRWDEDMPNLYLIPLYLVPVLPEGLEVTSISGNKKIVGKDYIDNDIRFGCIAYGINILKSESNE